MATRGVDGARERVARTALAQDRAELAERLRALRGQFDDIVSAASGGSTDDEHDPEGATIAYERAQVGALADQAQRRLDEVDAALRRLHEGTYGRCENCGRGFTADRLEARPSARTCIACARQ
jgi:DnaK suppressor protein